MRALVSQWLLKLMRTQSMISLQDKFWLIAVDHTRSENGRVVHVAVEKIESKRAITRIRIAYDFRSRYMRICCTRVRLSGRHVRQISPLNASIGEER